MRVYIKKLESINVILLKNIKNVYFKLVSIKCNFSLKRK